MTRLRVGVLLGACFVFRLLFGLSREFFFEDETQIFLLGFRYYATGAWPYFGPDVVWTQQRDSRRAAAAAGRTAAARAADPGIAVRAAQPAVVRRRSARWRGTRAGSLPRQPRWLIWGWLLTIPWTIQFSAHMINTSYILAPAIAVFFLGFFEAMPALRCDVIAAPRCVCDDGRRDHVADADPHVVAAAAAVCRRSRGWPAIATAPLGLLASTPPLSPAAR